MYIHIDIYTSNLLRCAMFLGSDKSSNFSWAMASRSPELLDCRVLPGSTRLFARLDHHQTNNQLCQYGGAASFKYHKLMIFNDHRFFHQYIP